MRVISGSARGRKLNAPPGGGTRPITDRAKEGIFNMLESLGGVDGVTALDLFAGSGSFGIECLSRGAEAVTFVERDRWAAQVLSENVDRLGFADRSTIIVGQAERAVVGHKPVDMAFCDPPYTDDPWQQLLSLIPSRLLVGHADTEIALTDEWVELRRRNYGRSRVVIAERPEAH